MATYRNTSKVAKKFYGVEFKPGEIRSVPGPINDSKMIRLPDAVKPTVIEATSDKDVGKKATEKSTSKSKQTGGNEDG